MKTIYISGPITDLKTGLPRKDWQRDFMDAEHMLRSMGFGVINPVDIAEETEEEWRQQWTFPGDMAKWNLPIADAIAKQPTRGTYIMSCIMTMNNEALAGRLHGMYVIGSGQDESTCRTMPSCRPLYAKQRIYHSDGVQMELHMSVVLGIPVFAQFYDGNEIDVHLLPIKDGKRLLAGGKFGKENWSER